MPRTILRAWTATALVWAAALLPGARGAGHGAVATVHPLATRAGIEAFEAGGNAVDAAIAASLTLGVVDPHNSGIGGGGFALVRRADGRVFALDGRETAPRRATRDMFIRDGRAVAELSLTGALAPGVPGHLALLDLLAREHGRLPLKRHLEEAARVADDGFVVSPQLAAALSDAAGELRAFPESARVYLKPDGLPWAAGETFRNPDLAATYRAIAEHGVRWFYRGEFARRTAGWMRENEGLLTRRDFRRYRVRTREPVRTTYRGCEIFGFPPPSSGGVHVAQVLQMVERFDLAGMGDRSVEFAHVMAEAMKRAFADRAHWLGDPDFVKVPVGLLAREYTDELSRAITPDRATPVAGHGLPPQWERDHFGRHTTHLSTADDEGNWVALTATVNTHFGSKVVVPGTGVVLNNEMDDFAAQPGVPNYFGLVGAEANAVAPAKRPLSSMSPTIVVRDGAPMLAIGGAGGPTIISQAVLAVIRVIDFGLGANEALAAPRLHHQWAPDEVVLERGWPGGAGGQLEARGHRVRRAGGIGVSQAVLRRDGSFEAAADPRAGGSAAVWRSGGGAIPSRPR